MNIYLIVEGLIGEKRVYSHWVPLTNSSLTIVSSFNQVNHNNLYIIAGGGYPNYFEVIENGVYDVANDNNFDRLVVGVDAEEMTYEEKKQEMIDFIEGLNTNIDYRIIVQNFCLETWALGNKKFIKRKPTSECGRKYRAIFDVRENDPEQLPGLPREGLNRAQFAVKYLKCIVNERNRSLTYSKSNPQVLLHPTYYEKVKERFETTHPHHIASFNDFLTAFV